MGVALIGCGYVADFYLATLPNYPDLPVRGVYDIDTDRAHGFARHHGLRVYPSLDSLLADETVAIVLNLTSPRSHYDVSRRCLDAGKNVYSEKPLAADLDAARKLVEKAERKGVFLAAAPCSLLGETAQTLWRAIRNGEIGRPRLVYAEIDDSPIHQLPYHTWISASGAPWPYLDEFQVGPVLEHAAYYVTWLTAFFGPAAEVVSFSALLSPDKLPGGNPIEPAPDFACACIRFRSGVAARLTCSTVAPADHGLTIVGDEGVLSIEECWDYGAEVTIRRRAENARYPKEYLADPERLELVRPAGYSSRYEDVHDMDFSRGVASLAAAIRSGKARHMTAQHAFHVLDVVLAMANSAHGPSHVTIASEFDALEPMPWAAH